MGFWSVGSRNANIGSRATHRRLFGREERAGLDISTAMPDGEMDRETAVLLSALVGNAEINDKSARGIPALSGAVDFIASTVAGLPVKLYREKSVKHDTEELTDDRRVFLLNTDTGDLMGAYQAKHALVSDMLTGGAGYMYINRSGGEIDSLHYVERGCVAVSKNADPIFKDADIMVNGKTYMPWDFIIAARNSRDGVTGESVTEQLKTLLSTLNNTLRYENTTSRTGGNKKGFLQSDKALSRKALDQIREAWENLYANNGNNMMVLNDGVKYVPSASSAVEMQLNQSKLTNSSLVGMTMLLSPDVISGKCSKEQFNMAVTTAVMPIILVLQEAYNRSLLTEDEKKSMYFIIDVSELLKSDTLAQYQAYEIALRSGFMQLDEIRYKLDMPALGFNYIRLGLSDVLLDPATGMIYTPNTNQAAKMGELGQIPDEDLQDTAEDDIINAEDNETRKKTNWVKGAKGYFAGSVPMKGGGAAKRMSVKERVRVTSEINTYYDRMENSKPILSKPIRDHFYVFENHGYNNYKFLAKIRIKGNEDYINMLRKDILS